MIGRKLAELTDMLRVKVNGKYVKTAREVADYFNKNIVTVYTSRRAKHPDKLDKLMLFEIASKFANSEQKNLLDPSGSIEIDGKKYLMTLSKVKDKK